MSSLGRQLELRAPDARRDHLHLVAVLYIGATVMLLLGAMSSQNNLLFAAVGIALATVIVSGFIAGSSMMGLRFARRVPIVAEADAPVRIGYLTHNRNKVLSAYAIRITDTARGPTGKIVPIRIGIDRIPARSERFVSANASLPYRGRWTLGPGRLMTMFPFGISKKSMRFDHGDTLLVTPSRRLLRPGTLGELESSGDDGRVDPRRRGQGVELFALRDYNRGDPVSSIAWRASAKWNRLISRESAAPRARRVWIVLEASHESLRNRDPLAEAAVRLAQAAGRRLCEIGVAPGLSVPSCGIAIPPDFSDTPEPSWLSVLTTLGDERVAATRHRSSPSDGVVAIGPGTTPGAIVVLDPSLEEKLTIDPRSHLKVGADS
ncbi:MAG: DUF58 domain-containing protein [Phycisphaerales bacterium]|nr:DUF58 domain-containing protein [Phycisphaerales bacterium]MCB9836210.1 DUF58 domain-containing protein [Phycisphaera sp.]